MYSAVMFDCDGVLIDSETLVGRVHSEMLTAFGFPLSYAEMVERFCGVRDDEMYAEIERDFGKKLPADYATSAARRIMEEFPRSLTAISGIDVALARIPKALCVVSSSPPEKLRYGLDLVGLSRFFGENIFSGWSVERGKPAPDVYFYAAQLMNVQPEQSLVIEDSTAGVTSGVAAGMTVLGFDGGEHCPSGHADRLLEIGARLVFSDMRELPGIIERIDRRPETFGGNVPALNRRPV